MAKLYVNPKGSDVRKHSYSAGGDFRKCRRFYYLKRVVGWREKLRGASMEFGKAVESGVQFFHENNMQPGSASAEFKRIWDKVKEIPNIDYKDETWENMAVMGFDMGRLYEAVFPSLGLSDLKFQINYEKELYPGTYLAGIKFTAFIDIIAKTRLSLVDPNEEPFPIVIDVKTTGQSYDETAEIHALDPQLRSYSWVSGIRNTAFLTFVKVSPNIKKGDTVTCLVNCEKLKAGERYKILSAGKEGDIAHVVLPLDLYDRYRESSKGLKGKQADTAIETFATQHGITVSTSAVTKQRIQFLPAMVSLERANDTGKMIGEQVAQIVRANEDNCYPEDGGTHFPNIVCTFCCMRGICTKNDKLRDELVELDTTPAAPQVESNWLDELEAVE